MSPAATAATAPVRRPEQAARTRDRILDAAFDRVSALGLSRTTVEDVARAARLSRQTIYRYYASKDELIADLVAREEEGFLSGAEAAFAANGDLASALEASILFCVRFARQHPLLDRLLATDGEILLPYLTTRGAPVITRAAGVLRTQIVRKAWVHEGLLEQTTDVLVRMVLSYSLTPSSRPNADVAADLARIATLALTAEDPPRRRSTR